MKALYEAILSRDSEQVEKHVRDACRKAGALEAANDILRFAVLSFAPSLHSRSAMYASLAAIDLLDAVDDSCALVVECARYAAESRVPWGEAPVTDPPRVPSSIIADDTTIDSAIDAEDLHHAERWLAALLESDAPGIRYMDAAARYAGEEGYGFCTAATAWRIADRFPPFARFAVLRTALLEWLQAGALPEEEEKGFQDSVSEAIRAYVEGAGRPELFQPILLADSIVAAENATGAEDRYRTLLTRYLSRDHPPGEGEGDAGWELDDLVYRYAVDYGTFLQSVPVSGRLERIAGREACEKIPRAARHFLEHPEDFEEWSFA